jgi:hypothetical protein
MWNNDTESRTRKQDEDEESTTSNPGEQHFLAEAQNLDLTDLLYEVGQIAADIDRRLFEVGEALNVTQPHSGGKIGLRWWKNGHGKRMPVLVEWQFGKDKKLRPERIKTNSSKLDDSTRYLVRRAKTKGTFKINHDQTVELLEIVVKLMSMRSSLLDGVTRVKKTLSAIKRNQKPVVTWQERRIKSIHEEARQNMRNAGYP